MQILLKNMIFFISNFNCRMLSVLFITKFLDFGGLAFLNNGRDNKPNNKKMLQIYRYNRRFEVNLKFEIFLKRVTFGGQKLSKAR